LEGTQDIGQRAPGVGVRYNFLMTSLRKIPAIDTLLRSGGDLIAAYGHEQTVRVLRRVVDEARQAAFNGKPVPDDSTLIAQAADLLARESRPTLRPVINATGVIIHTNLGRAPLSESALDAIRAVGSGYSTLEYELDRTQARSRIRDLLDMTGANRGWLS
jgi:L-seryl-tRNA(Ser) seleniumtransferase